VIACLLIPYRTCTSRTVYRLERPSRTVPVSVVGPMWRVSIRRAAPLRHRLVLVAHTSVFWKRHQSVNALSRHRHRSRRCTCSDVDIDINLLRALTTPFLQSNDQVQETQ